MATSVKDRSEGRIHAASPDSDRLTRVLEVLADGAPHSTRGIMREAGVCAVNSCVAELRAHGYRIDCSPRFSKGRVIYCYRLEGD